MKRTPEPHGTKAAYMRHRRAGEEACEACKKAKSKPAKNQPPRQPKRNREETAMDRDLAKNPPQILWRTDGHGVMRHIYIDDPHAERESKPRKPKGLRSIDIEYLEDIS